MHPRQRDRGQVRGNVTWDRLRAAAGRESLCLRAPLPAGPGCCTVCRGPTRGGYLRCFHSALHRRRAPGLLADVVVPVSYSVAGTAYARMLWLYKSDGAGQNAARTALRLMLLVFLHEHGRCVWACARIAAPTHVAVVPTGRGRPGAHPLEALVGPYLALPPAALAIRPGEPVYGRDLHTGRFQAAGRLTGATVLLLDDTWTSGSSAQSAAAALKLAGARSVVTVVLGRHVNPSDPLANSLAAALAGSSFRAELCAVHGAAA